MAAAISTFSGQAKVKQPYFWSMMEGYAISLTGTPGLTNWVSTSPAKSSATVITKVPASVAGDVPPAEGIV